MLKNDVLEYIKLDLNKIPKKLLENNSIHFDNYKNLNMYKIYEYVSIHNLEILITPLDRTAELKERLKSAKTLTEYLMSDDKKLENTFNEILEQASVEEIKKLEEMQESFTKDIPYLVKYDKNYLWQIYYSKKDDKYFMLFPANEGETSVLFYIIKKKLEKKDTKIFVPVCKQEFSEKILDSLKINEIENYIWLFTENWPNIYEVCQDKIYITGKTKVGGIIESSFRNIFYSKEEAENYYKLLKTLFILTTETNYLYTFDTYINEDGSLGLKYKDNLLKLENIKEFITNQIEKKNKNIAELNEKLEKENNYLKELKEYIKKQNEIYVMQEKQIVMFLQCKKSFFKKISYFFKSKKFITPNIKISLHEDKKISKKEIDKINSYNIKELIDLTLQEKETISKIKTVETDEKALKIKKENLERKIKNASIYLSEIEKHKKSIFEFWKFTNKDATQQLVEGEAVKESDKKESENIIKNFKIEEDLDLLGQKMDRMQRELLSENEINAIYNLKYSMEIIKNIEEDEELEKLLHKIKEKQNEDEIFSDLLDDYTNIVKINNKECRERKRKPFRGYLINNEENGKERIKKIVSENKKIVDNALKKIISLAKISIYVTEIEKENTYIIGEIQAEKIIKETKGDIKIYKINVECGSNAIYLTNIIFFNNINNTLPVGMNIETKILLKMPKINKKNMHEKTIHVLEKENEFKYRVRKISIISLN